MRLTRICSSSSETRQWRNLPQRQQFLITLGQHNNEFISRSRNGSFWSHVPTNVSMHKLCNVTRPRRWNKLVKAGRKDVSQPINSMFTQSSLPPSNSAKTILDDVDRPAFSKYTLAATPLAQVAKQVDTCEDMREMFELLQKGVHSELLSRDGAQTLRDQVLAAALTNKSWLDVLVDTAHRLLAEHNFHWPDLYMKIMQHILENGDENDSIRWHLRLAPNFLPPIDMFGAILSNFILDSSPRMQSNMLALYISSTEKNLYDHIIPVLFSAGRSELARFWRKELLLNGDLPRSNQSTPFLHFLLQYYPSITLTDEELVLAKISPVSMEDAPSPSPSRLSHYDDSSKGQLKDSIMAKWFASSWTSIDFAVHLAQRLGLHVIGPRSLQSLALREPSAKLVASRLAFIQKLGVTVSTKNYCKVLEFFAKDEKDVLLTDLLTCDIHPDEFDHVETRQRLMASSVRDRDWKKLRLLQGIEWALESESSSHRLNTLLQLEVKAHKRGRARQILDRMEALKINMNGQSASLLLVATFRGIGKHFTKRKCRARIPHKRYQSLLNGAIDIIRRVALHNVAIPLRFWKLLLFNLGRLGRLNELQQLSEELVQLYLPPSGGLIPICFEDHPQSLEKNRNATDSFRDTSKPSVDGKDNENQSSHVVNSPSRNFGNLKPAGRYHRRHQGACGATAYSSSDLAMDSFSRDTKSHTETCVREDRAILYIPTDLPFTHRQHPVRRLFDLNLQRSIIRWGFDQNLAKPPASSSLQGLAETDDITSGVRLLARLRDLGVLIDSQALRAVILSRIALGQYPTRDRDRSRDHHELSLERLKFLFDEAWGSEILPSIPEMRRQLEKKKPKLWKNYTWLFGKAFALDGRQMVLLKDMPCDKAIH